MNGNLMMSSSIKTFGFEEKINGPYKKVHGPTVDHIHLVVSYSRFENLPQSDCLSRKSEIEFEKIEISSG